MRRFKVRVYVRQLMSPVPFDILLMSMRSVTNGSRLFTLLVNRVNDLRNPDFLDASPVEPDPQFARFVELLTELSKVGVLDLVGDTQKEVAFNAVINGNAPQYSHKGR